MMTMTPKPVLCWRDAVKALVAADATRNRPSPAVNVPLAGHAGEQR